MAMQVKEWGMLKITLAKFGGVASSYQHPKHQDGS